MYKDPVYALMGELVEIPVTLGYIGGQNDFPRIEVYSNMSAGQLDKGPNSKEVDVTFDIITDNRGEGKANYISEVLQNHILENPVEVENFDVDMVRQTGTTSLQEMSNDNRVINRVLVTYTYNLTQTI